MCIKKFLYLSVLFCTVASSSLADKIPYDGDTTVIAGKQYKAGWLKQFLLGSHYRKAWITPVNVQVFDLDTIKGGLTPIKQGGSRQTTNLRLKDSMGREYVVRSVNKTPSRVLPKKLQKTIAGKFVQDQTSAEHPYALNVIPHLSNAAGIYHTNPKLYFIPYDTGFGEFTETFANMLVYFEERPNEDMSHSPNTGSSKNVIGTDKLFEELYQDADNKVDERFYIKTRLFDMWIGDWGRHEDQWRWAEYEHGKGKLYRPVPRDRDHSFFKFDGILPHLGSRKWSFRQFANFDDKARNIYGLNRSATPLDRSFMSQLNKSQWLEIAEELKTNLSDEVIDNSMKKMPANIYALDGREITKKLKSRRDHLPEVASRYYKEINKNVNVIGSNNAEFFEIHRLAPSQTEVVVFKCKDHKDTLYHRIFNSKETKEIRIYGLGGNDEYHVSGNAKKGSRVRMIGGEGEDLYADNSTVTGVTKRNYVYDEITGSKVDVHKETKNLSTDKPGDSITLFKRDVPDYNYTALIPTAEYNPDDGVFLGFGLMRKTFGYRKTPYATLQRTRINYATQTSSVSFRYMGDFKEVAGRWNLLVENRIYGPRFAWNYFGFGNNTELLQDTAIEYYRVRADRVYIQPVLYKNFTDKVEAGFGAHYEYVNIQQTEGRFISEPGAVQDPEDFTRNNFVGALGFIQVTTTDTKISPSKGYLYYGETGLYDQVDENKLYANINSSFALFLTPKLPFRVTFATRVGAAHNFGDFVFYRGNRLGGSDNIRAFRRNRFYGRTSAYHNMEARIYLGSVNFYLFPGKIGLLSFFDYGRVWADNEKSNRIHSGFGPGAFIQIYNHSIVSATYGFSEDGQYLNVQLGFVF